MPALERNERDRDPEDQPTINPVQQLQLELMRQASFNDFSGEQVVSDLIAHRDLWRGAIMDSGYAAWGEYDEVINLTKLRDLERGQWNVSTLFILTSGRDDASLEALARERWHAYEVGYVEEPDMGIYPHPPDLKILRVWWE